MTGEAFPEPVLILAFNRPDRVAALIDRLREVRPAHVYLSVDGPRAHVATDADRVRQTQALAQAIDWPCTVHTHLADAKLGCGLAVSGGIDWFFEHVERGIILEDDVLPSVPFFRFCADLLEQYADDPRVYAISGCNFAPPEAITHPGSYRFSALTHVWGWATWRRAWADYRFDMADWRTRLPLGRRWRAMGSDLPGFVYWSTVFDWMRFGSLDTWDYQWSLAQMAAGGLTATSNVNLVENVGFDSDATHTVHAPGFIRPVETIAFPLRPTPVERDLRADRWVRKQVLQASTQGVWRMVKGNLLQRLARGSKALRGAS